MVVNLMALSFTEKALCPRPVAASPGNGDHLTSVRQNTLSKKPRREEYRAEMEGIAETEPASTEVLCEASKSSRLQSY